MLRIIDCLTYDHDLRLVALAMSICAAGVITALIVADRVATSSRRSLWLVLLGLCVTGAAWSTHFISMLAYRTVLPTVYDLELTVLSFVVGGIFMGWGFKLAVTCGGRLRFAIHGGMIAGVGLALLHYIGMAAVRFPAHPTYSGGLVAVSVASGMLMGAAALGIGFASNLRYRKFVAGVLLLLMIGIMHFSAMGAAQLELSSSGLAGETGISRATLVAVVAVVTMMMFCIGIAGAIVDHRVSLLLAADTERYRTLADGAFEGLVVHSNGTILDANVIARQMFGWGDRLTDHTLHDALSGSEPRARPMPGEGGVQTAEEVMLRRTDGTIFPAEVCRRPMRTEGGGTGELLAIRDISARKKSEQRIAYLALHDPLTDLANRACFTDLATKAIRQAQAAGTQLAILAVDLDGFKLVNDVHGHGAGDEVLRAVAQRIASTLRAEDIAARFGGDEFAILQMAVSQPEQVLALADRLNHLIQGPVSVGSVEVTVSASIGVAFFPKDGATLEELLRNADTAMYCSKAEGKATCRTFEQQMEEAMTLRRKLAGQLRTAVDQNRLTVAFQPIVATKGRSPLAMECLLRWDDPILGSVPASEFIPVAEETGLIVQIGEQVLSKACGAAVAWPRQVRVAVNLSAVQFRRHGLVDAVRSALRESGLPGNRLELEITESLLIENRSAVLKTLNELKAMGISISMDDFGTGFSSLAYLHSFPFDKIKIDREFVADLCTNRQNALIVQAMAAMGASLGMSVVAEGVETEEQARMLEKLGCDGLQGYLIAKPMSDEELSAFLANERLSETWTQLLRSRRRLPSGKSPANRTVALTA